VVEVRPDHALRARVRERVAGRALPVAEEELLAADVVARRGQPAGAATRRGQGRDQNRAGADETAQSHLGGGPRGGRSGADGRLARRVDREDTVEAGDLEDLRDVAVAADERQLARA